MKEKSRCNFKERSITGSKLAGPWVFFSIAEKPPSMRSLPLRGPKLFSRKKKIPNVLIPGPVGKKIKKKRGGGVTIKRVLAYDKQEPVTDTGENTSTQ